MILTFEQAITLHIDVCKTFQWRHNGLDSVSNHQPHGFDQLSAGYLWNPWKHCNERKLGDFDFWASDYASHRCLQNITMTSYWARWRFKSPASRFRPVECRLSLKSVKTLHWAKARWFWLLSKRLRFTSTSAKHFNDVIMGSIASQITSLTVVYSIVYWVTDQRKHQSSASLAFVWGIHRGPVNSPHKWPVTRKMFPFDDIIMKYFCCVNWFL